MFVYDDPHGNPDTHPLAARRRRRRAACAVRRDRPRRARSPCGRVPARPARAIISEVPAASRMPFRYTINPYRGCSHACTYCFARPTHEYLGLNGGDDFERRIVVKVNAVERLARRARAARAGRASTSRWARTPTPTSSARAATGSRAASSRRSRRPRNPFSILTKSTMIQRDRDVLAAAAERGRPRELLDRHARRGGLAQSASPARRRPGAALEALARLTEAGLPCGVLVAPILPGLSDGLEQLAQVVRACVEAGAVSISPIGLHLRPGVRELFMPWLEGVRPDLVERYERLYHRRAGYRARAPRAHRRPRAAARRPVRRRDGVPGRRPRRPDAAARRSAARRCRAAVAVAGRPARDRSRCGVDPWASGFSMRREDR